MPSQSATAKQEQEQAEQQQSEQVARLEAEHPTTQAD
jgi:hypothetical protein